MRRSHPGPNSLACPEWVCTAMPFARHTPSRSTPTLPIRLLAGGLDLGAPAAAASAAAAPAAAAAAPLDDFFTPPAAPAAAAAAPAAPQLPVLLAADKGKGLVVRGALERQAGAIVYQVGGAGCMCVCSASSFEGDRMCVQSL